MIYEVVAVKDNLTGFSAPQLEINIDSAKRRFRDAVEETKHMSKHIADFSLYRLGSFDVEKGLMLVPDYPEFICSGAELFVSDGCEV